MSPAAGRMGKNVLIERWSNPNPSPGRRHARRVWDDARSS